MPSQLIFVKPPFSETTTAQHSREYTSNQVDDPQQHRQQRTHSPQRFAEAITFTPQIQTKSVHSLALVFLLSWLPLHLPYLA
jgi:hypothetical protein